MFTFTKVVAWWTSSNFCIWSFWTSIQIFGVIPVKPVLTTCTPRSSARERVARAPSPLPTLAIDVCARPSRRRGPHLTLSTLATSAAETTSRPWCSLTLIRSVFPIDTRRHAMRRRRHPVLAHQHCPSSRAAQAGALHCRGVGVKPRPPIEGVVPPVVSPFCAWRTGVELLLAAIAMDYASSLSRASPLPSKRTTASTSSPCTFRSLELASSADQVAGTEAQEAWDPWRRQTSSLVAPPPQPTLGIEPQVILRATTALSRPDRILPSPESISAHRPWRQGLHCDWIFRPRDLSVSIRDLFTRTEFSDLDPKGRNL
jgi:hypothetical protein